MRSVAADPADAHLGRHDAGWLCMLEGAEDGKLIGVLRQQSATQTRCNTDDPQQG